MPAASAEHRRRFWLANANRLHRTYDAGLEVIRARRARARRCDLLGSLAAKWWHSSARPDPASRRSFARWRGWSRSRERTGHDAHARGQLRLNRHFRPADLARRPHRPRRQGIARPCRRHLPAIQSRPRLSVLTNVCLGLLGRMPFVRGTLSNFTMDEKRRAMHALDSRRHGRACPQARLELSGGQQQRAAIARTLVQGAELLVADEPIASLDPASARRVMDILAEMNRRDGITVLVSLHQVEYALTLLPAHHRVEGRARSSMTGRPRRSRRNCSAASTAPRASELFLPGFDHAGAPLASRVRASRASPSRCALRKWHADSTVPLGLASATG